MNPPPKPPRRRAAAAQLLPALGRRRRGRRRAAAVVAQPAPHAGHPPPAVPAPQALLFFNPWEAAWIRAATDRLIPADASGPGALQAGVPAFIDRQLAGAWGAGERLYRSGPWQAGLPQQGYQLPYTPAELFRAALTAWRSAEQAGGGTAFTEQTSLHGGHPG
nr:gluconate 2-dehydrogenase subunit 3 family protein [Variovorax boronicumulans]